MRGYVLQCILTGPDMAHSEFFFWIAHALPPIVGFLGAAFSAREDQNTQWEQTVISGLCLDLSLVARKRSETASVSH